MSIEKLILGTVQFGLPYGINNQTGQLSKESVFKILNLAYENGITLLDTAGAYGQAEKILGEYFSLYKAKSFKVITKLDLS